MESEDTNSINEALQAIYESKTETNLQLSSIISEKLNTIAVNLLNPDNLIILIY